MSCRHPYPFAMMLLHQLGAFFQKVGGWRGGAELGWTTHWGNG